MEVMLYIKGYKYKYAVIIGLLLKLIIILF